jgi:hypothetical protein
MCSFKWWALWCWTWNYEILLAFVKSNFFCFENFVCICEKQQLFEDIHEICNVANGQIRIGNKHVAKVNFCTFLNFLMIFILSCVWSYKVCVHMNFNWVCLHTQSLCYVFYNYLQSTYIGQTFFFKPIIFRVWICNLFQFAKLIQIQTQCIAWLICQIASTTHKANFCFKLFATDFLFVSSATDLQFISNESRLIYYCIGLLQFAHMMAPPLKPLTNFQFWFFLIGSIVLETFDANT